MENLKTHIYFDNIGERDKDYFVYIFNPSKEAVFNTINILYKDSLDTNKIKNAVQTLENFWIRDNSTIHSFIIKEDKNIIGLVVGNIRVVSSVIQPDYNIFVARFMKIVPAYKKHFKELTEDVLFQVNAKSNLVAILATDSEYKRISNSLTFWMRPLKVRKNQNLGGTKIIDPKKYLPRSEHIDRTKWMLHVGGKTNIGDVMNWYLAQKRVTFIKYTEKEEPLMTGKNIRVYHDKDFTKLFAFLEQPHDMKSCLVFYVHNVHPEEIAAFLYKNTEYTHVMFVIPGVFREEFLESTKREIATKIYVERLTILNQILPDPSIENFDLVPIGEELLSTIL